MSTWSEDLAGYNAGKLRADLVAGLTVATLAVPQSMAYATIADIDPIYGLYSAIVVTIASSITSSCTRLIHGPTNAIAIMIADIPLTHLMSEYGVAGDQVMHVIFLLTALIGLIQLVGAAVRLGGFANFISPSVIVGFTLGAAILIIIKQIPKLMDIDLPIEGEVVQIGPISLGEDLESLRTLAWAWQQRASAHGITMALGLGCMAFMLGHRWARNAWTRRRRSEKPSSALIDWALRYIPRPLIAIAGAALVVGIFGLEGRGVELVKMTEGPLPKLSMPLLDLKLAWALMPSALAIAVVGLIEAVSVAKAINQQDRRPFDPNIQLASEGIGNLTGGFFSSFAGSSSFTRSALNLDVGAETRLAGIASGLMILVFLVVGGRALEFIPMAALSGVLIAVALTLVNFRQIARSFKASRAEAIIVITTSAWAVLFSLEGAILVGVILSFVFYMPRAARLQTSELIRDANGTIRERGRDEPTCAELTVLDIEGALFFGALPSLEKALAGLSADPARHKILRVHNAHDIDAVAAETLLRFIAEERERGIQIILCGIRRRHRDQLRRAQVLALLGPEDAFLEENLERDSTARAVAAAYLRIGPHECPLCASGNSPEDMTPFTYMI